MEIQPLDQLTKIINDALNGTAKLHKSFKTFFVTTSILFLSTRLFHLRLRCILNERGIFIVKTMGAWLVYFVDFQ